MCLKLKHHQAFHGSCQAAHLPYISLIGGPVPHRMETCACTGQQSWTFAGTVGPPGSDEFNVCAQQQIITLAAHRLGPAAVREQRQWATPLYNRTAPSKNTEQLPGLCKAKHTHTEVYFGVFQVKTLLLHIAAHRTRAVKGRRDGPLGRSCSRMRTAPGITVHFILGK